MTSVEEAVRISHGPVARSKRLTMPSHRMLALTIVDQGASSISNFAVAILVAHYSGAVALGVFGLVTSTYVITQGTVRAFTSNCLLSRPETDDAVMTVYERAGYLTALVLSIVISLGVLAVTAALTKQFVTPFLIFGLAFPTLAMQDFARYIGISRHDPAYAIRLDMAWLVLFLLLFGVLHDAGTVNMPLLFGAWTVSGGVVGIGTLRAHLGSDARSLLRFWARSERSVGLRFAGQFLVTSVTNYLIFYLLVLFVISVAAVGTIKLALLAVGPVTVMSAGVQSGIIPLVAKRFQHDRRGAMRFLHLVALGLAVVTGAWTALLYAAPVHTMRTLLGPVWPQARQLAPFGGLSLVFMAVAGVWGSGLVALRAARANLWLSVAIMPVFLGAPLYGAALAGTHGYVKAAAVAGAVDALASLVVLVRVSKKAQLAVPQTLEATAALAAEGTGLP